MVLGKKTRAFNTVNQKNNFYGTLGYLKRGNQRVHSEEIPVRDCVKAEHVRSQTRSANHHMSCRRSRKFLCAPENPQNTTGLNLNFTVLYVKLIDLSYFK